MGKADGPRPVNGGSDMDINAEHNFGGNWTLVKLELLKQYLSMFNKALRSQPSSSNPFRRIYIDAFAGTGQCAITVDGERLNIDGSAKIALEVKPQFDALYFIDMKKRHVRALSMLAQNNNTRNIEVCSGDCNEQIGAILSKIDWQSSRAVMFLDPFGMSVRWETLELIAATGAIDVWYLFPLNAVCRQAAHRFDKVDQAKSDSLTRLFGTENWIEEFYVETGQTDLFSDGKEGGHRERKVDQKQIQQYAKKRLKARFPVVLDPLQLPIHGSPLFSLFFMSSNSNDKAVALTTKLAGYLLMHGHHGVSGAAANEGVAPGANLNLF